MVKHDIYNTHFNSNRSLKLELSPDLSFQPPAIEAPLSHTVTNNFSLVELLEITKQSLAPVIKQLIQTDHAVPSTAMHDRRHRPLFPTLKGRELILALTVPQWSRISHALSDYSSTERRIVENFLYNMVNPEQRQQITELNEQITTTIES